MWQHMVCRVMGQLCSHSWLSDFKLKCTTEKTTKISASEFKKKKTFKVIQLFRIFQNRKKGEVSQPHESASAFLRLNRAALDHNCFSINGCYGHINEGHSADKFSFLFLYWETVCINRGYL